MSLFMVTFIVFIGTVASQMVNYCPANLPRDQYLQFYNDYCFQFVIYRQRTFWNANDDCVNNGGHLVIVKSQDINNFLVDKLLNTYQFQDRLWIGLHDTTKEGVYLWIDNSSLDYTNWPSSGPGQHRLEDCIAMDPQTNGDWHEYRCENELFGPFNFAKPYICQYEAVPQFITTPTTTATTALPSQ